MRLIVLLLFSPVALLGQVKDLDSIVVTASLQAQHERETGRNIQVVRGEWLRGLPATSLDEILRYLPGVEVQQRGPQGSQADILIRGGTFQQVLILIDGVRLNDPLTGHFNGYIPLHPSEIDRIEVLKGAAASIHGSDAIGGVIHVITKTGAMSGQDTRHKYSAGVETGAMGLRNVNGWWRMRTERSSLSAAVTSQNAEGPALRGTTGFFHNHSASIGYAKTLGSDWNLSLRSAVDLRDFNAQNYYTVFASDTANERVRSAWQQVHLRKNGTGYRLHVDAAYKALEDVYRFRPAVAPNENRTRMFVGQVYALLRTDRRTRLTTGLQYIRRTIRSNDRGDHALDHAAAYVVASHRLGASFHVNESLRLDWDGNYGAVLVPQANGSWTRSRLTLRGSMGSGIRDADFTERYNNYNKPLVTGGSIGNPWLRTERSWSYEAGADFRLHSRLKASAGVFRRSQRDLIDWTPTPYAQMPRKDNLATGATYALATNLSSVQTGGFEFDLRYEGKSDDPGRRRLMLMAGLLILDSKSADKMPSFYISSHARALINASVIYRVGDFDLNGSIVWKRRNVQQAAAIGADLSREYLLCNLRLRYTVKPVRGAFFLQAYNLFDRRFSDLLGSRMPGRWLSAGVQFGG
jgi:iron complex outermembrane receptor protein